MEIDKAPVPSMPSCLVSEIDITVTKRLNIDRSLLNARASRGSRPVGSSQGLSAPPAEAQTGEEAWPGLHI